MRFKFLWLMQARLQHALEHVVGQKPHILRKHAEDQSVDEMRDDLGGVTACA